MINFQGIEFAYSNVCKERYIKTVSEVNPSVLIIINGQLSGMINSMLIANQIVIMAQRYVTELSCEEFSLPFDSYGSLSHIRVAELALQIKYGNITLTPENPMDDSQEEFQSVKVTWKAKMQYLNEADRKMHKNSLLFLAVMNASTSKISSLLEEGADPNTVGPFGRTPVYAVMKNPEHIKILGSQGAKGNVKDKFGLTPQMVASTFGRNSVFSTNVTLYLK